jgi:hypothetical protein
MSLFKGVRLTTAAERRRMGSPLQKLLIWTGLKKEAPGERDIFHYVEFFSNLDEQDAVLNLINDWEELEQSDFYQKYNPVFELDQIWSEEKFAERNRKSSVLELLVLWVLVREGAILKLHHSVEAYSRELAVFAERRLRDFYNEDFGLIEGNWTEEAALEDQLMVQLQELDEYLKHQGYRLIDFLVGTDEYYLCVVPGAVAAQLVEMQFGVITVRPCSG